MRDTTFNLSDMYKESNLYYQSPMSWNELLLKIYMGLCRYENPDRIIKYLRGNCWHYASTYPNRLKVLMQKAKDIIKEYQNIGFTPEQAYNNDIWHEF